MFQKRKKVKAFACIIIGMIVLAVIVSNVKIKSVDAYKSEKEDNAREQQIVIDMEQNSQNTSFQDSNAPEQSDRDSIDNGILENQLEQSTENSTVNEISNADNQNAADHLIDDLSGGIDKSNKEDISGTLTDSSDSESKTDSFNPPEGGNSSSLKQIESQTIYVTCTIEIRCDQATEKKSQITNEGLKDYIPDDGTILKSTSFRAESGYSVFDVLSYVTGKYRIPIATNADKTYVRSINNLVEKEKELGRWSGWTYFVNGVMPGSTASNYVVSEGDTIVWNYVCN